VSIRGQLIRRRRKYQAAKAAVLCQRVEDNAFHLGIREKDRSARESHELARMIFFLSEFSRPFALFAGSFSSVFVSIRVHTVAP
jgi:hypothetical protein